MDSRDHLRLLFASLALSLLLPVRAGAFTGTYTGGAPNFCLPGIDSFDWGDCYNYDFTVFSASAAVLAGIPAAVSASTASLSASTASLRTDLTAETARAVAAEAALTSAVNSTGSAVTNENARALAAEALLAPKTGVGLSISTANVVPGFNSASNFVQMTGAGAYPAASGAAITSLTPANISQGTADISIQGAATSEAISVSAGNASGSFGAGGILSLNAGVGGSSGKGGSVIVNAGRDKPNGPGLFAVTDGNFPAQAALVVTSSGVHVTSASGLIADYGVSAASLTASGYVAIATAPTSDNERLIAQKYYAGNASTDTISMLGDSLTGDWNLVQDADPVLGIGAQPVLAIRGFGGGNGSSPVMVFEAAEGNHITPSATLANDCSFLGTKGYGTSETGSKAALQMCATENWSGSANGMDALIQITKKGTTSRKTVATFDESGETLSATTASSGSLGVAGNLNVVSSATFKAQVQISTGLYYSVDLSTESYNNDVTISSVGATIPRVAYSSMSATFQLANSSMTWEPGWSVLVTTAGSNSSFGILDSTTSAGNNTQLAHFMIPVAFFYKNGMTANFTFVTVNNTPSGSWGSYLTICGNALLHWSTATGFVGSTREVRVEVTRFGPNQYWASGMSVDANNNGYTLQSNGGTFPGLQTCSSPNNVEVDFGSSGGGGSQGSANLVYARAWMGN